MKLPFFLLEFTCIVIDISLQFDNFWLVQEVFTDLRVVHRVVRRMLGFRDMHYYLNINYKLQYLPEFILN